MDFPTEVRAEWSVDHGSAHPRLERAPVGNSEELDRLLDQLGANAAETEPFIVEFVSPSGARLGIGLGAAVGSVLAFKESDDPPYYLSAGASDSTSDSEVSFYYQGHWTEFPAGALVPIERARAAAAQFFSTGRRPTSVNWEEV